MRLSRLGLWPWMVIMYAIMHSSCRRAPTTGCGHLERLHDLLQSPRSLTINAGASLVLLQVDVPNKRLRLSEKPVAMDELLSRVRAGDVADGIVTGIANSVVYVSMRDPETGRFEGASVSHSCFVAFVAVWDVALCLHAGVLHSPPVTIEVQRATAPW